MANYIQRLKSCSSRSDLAMLLGFKPKAFSYILYQIEDNNKYSIFEITKKSGGVRTIHAPVPQLKLLQSRLAEYLANCVTELETLDGIKLEKSISHGFQRGRSIRTNADIHVNREWVLNFDLKDFFPSINFGRVRGFFLKNKRFLLNERVATTIAQIACHENFLPQGSPCSPVLANMITHILDMRLNRISKEARCSYTRYADDLTFSSNRSEFPSIVAIQTSSGIWDLSQHMHDTIKSCGFAVAKSKTRMQFSRSRQDVTGLIVNHKVNVSREYYKTTRAQCKELIKNGSIYRKSMVLGKEELTPISTEVLRGKLAHIFNIKSPELGNSRSKDSVGKWPCYVRNYRHFLDYTTFATADRPTYLFEGKTDNTYIRCALRSLAKDYPDLVADDRSRKLLINMMRYSRTTDMVQSLAGGTGDLKLLINTYAGRLSDVSSARPSHPIILVVDNDQGSKELFSAAGSKSEPKVTVDGSAQFYHIFHNLYLVPTPKSAGMPESYIENFLPKEVLDVKWGVKTFHLPEKGFDLTKHYGKAILAEKIVQKNQTTIDFSGFRPLLDAMTAAQKHYYK